MKYIRQVIPYILKYKGAALLNILFNILSVLFGLFSITMVIPFLGFLFGSHGLVNEAPPLTLEFESLKQNFYFLISNIIKHYSAGSVEQGKMQALIFICLVAVSAFFLKNLFRYLAMYYIGYLRNGVIKDLRNKIYDKVIALPQSYYSKERKGDIMARISNDVTEVEWSIMSALEVIFREPFTIIASIVLLIGISAKLTLIVFLILPVTGLLIGSIGKSLKRSSVKAQGLMGTLFSGIEETLGGLKIIKAFTAESFMSQKFRNINDAYTRVMVKVYRKRDLSSPLSEFLGAVATVTVMYFGARMVLQSGSSFMAEDLIGYIAMFSQIIPPAKAFSTAYYNVQKGLASVERINSILDAEVTITDSVHVNNKNSFESSIEFKNVSFSYGNEMVLKNINLVIAKGKTVALVGPSGAGKSTLVDLIPRFYDVSSGALLIDGTDVRQIKLSSLRQLSGVVTQESILFNDTVYNNIAFGMQSFTPEQVHEAARIANAHDFIMQLPEQYESNIGDRGTKLSGGQRQRLSIARAVLKNPPILILDEATSALDTESERLVQDSLTRLMQNRTTVVIAHRLSTIQHADEIIVMQQGEIAERGSHQMLSQQNGLYSKLLDMQSFS